MRQWTKVYGRDLLTSARFMSCPPVTRGLYVLLLIGFTDDDGLICAFRSEDGAAVPYGGRELAAELRMSDRSVRRGIEELKACGLVKESVDIPGVLFLPRFKEKAGQDAAAATGRRRAGELIASVRDAAARANGELTRADLYRAMSAARRKVGAG